MTALEEVTRRRRAHMDAQYRKRWIAAQHFGVSLTPVDAQPTRQHIQKLNELGWSNPALQELTGNEITDSTTLLIAGNNQATVHVATAHHVARIPHTLNVPDLVSDTSLVPAAGAARRIRALMALGWRHSDFKTRGIHTEALVKDTYTQMTAARWRQIDAVFRELCMTPGPSQKTLKRSLAKGWPPPLAFDDIDDPNEHPKGVGFITITRWGDYADDYHQLRLDGYPLDIIADRLNMRTDALMRALERHNDDPRAQKPRRAA